MWFLYFQNLELGGIYKQIIGNYNTELCRIMDLGSSIFSIITNNVKYLLHASHVLSINSTKNPMLVSFSFITISSHR